MIEPFLCREDCTLVMVEKPAERQDFVDGVLQLEVKFVCQVNLLPLLFAAVKHRFGVYDVSRK